MEMVSLHPSHHIPPVSPSQPPFTVTMTPLIAILAFAPLMLVASPVPTPPGIPSGSTAKSQLAALTVAPLGSSTGYSRDLFNHWTTVSGSCNTRETVLKRDGTNVVTDSACAATSGSWYSPYDGATWYLASDVVRFQYIEQKQLCKITRLILVIFRISITLYRSATPGNLVQMPGQAPNASNSQTI